ncbi:MAG: thioredoxin [Thalassobaculales bacterium]
MDYMLGQGPKPANAAGTAGGNAALIKDTTTASFMADVIDASRGAPVIVDFWAPWCGPCKQLQPALERAVTEARGAVRLVKLNIDDHPEIAQQMRIQSIPAVYAFKDGRPVDGFVGALPESQVKAFVQRLAKLGGPVENPIEEAIAEARAMIEEGDGRGAGALLSQVLQHEPQNVAALALLARVLLGEGDIEQAKTVLERVPAAKREEAEVAGVRSAIELAEKGAAAARRGPELQARLAANPKDHEARLELASALYAAGDREGAVDQLLESFRLDRSWNEEAARKELVKLFEAFGPTDPLTISARRRLSALMFS